MSIWYMVQGNMARRTSASFANVYSRKIHRCKALSMPTADIREVTFVFNRVNF